MFHLPLLNQLLHSSGDLFDWHVQVNAVLIEQVDGLHLESLERAVDSLLDVRWPAVQAWRNSFSAVIQIRIEIEPEFRGDHNVLAERGERFADEFFICERAVNFRGIKERNAALYRGAEKSGHLLFVLR